MGILNVLIFVSPVLIVGYIYNGKSCFVFPAAPAGEIGAGEADDGGGDEKVVDPAGEGDYVGNDVDRRGEIQEAHDERDKEASRRPVEASEEPVPGHAHDVGGIRDEASEETRHAAHALGIGLNRLHRASPIRSCVHRHRRVAPILL